MRDHRSRPEILVLGLALLIAVTGCQSARPAAPPPATSADLLGELTGTWTGTWGDTPLTLVVVEHTEGAPYSGLYFGPWLLAGGRYPGISGVLTYARAGAPASVRFNGWIYSSRPFTVLIQAEPPDGPLHARLHGAGAAALVGEGEATFRWGPRGRIELTRQ